MALGLALCGQLSQARVAVAQPSASFPEPDSGWTTPSESTPAPAEPTRVSPAPVSPAPAQLPPSSIAPPPALPASLVPPLPQLSFRPPVLPAYDGMEPPPGYRLESHANTALVVGGVLTFSVGYVVGVGYAVSQDFEEGTGWLMAPVIGPWLAVARRNFDCAVEGDNPLAEAERCQQVTQREAAAVGLLAALGLAQGLGATLALIGVLDRDKQWVREDLGGVEVSVDVGPRPGGGGATLFGRF